MGFIKINSISLSPAPTVDKLVTVMYRLTSDPDIPASYTVATSSLDVPVGGVLATPFIIDHLSDATSYTIKVRSDCGNYSIEHVFVTGTVCPHITAIIDSDLIAYWGWKSTKDILAEVDIVSSTLYQFITATQDITCTFTGGSASPEYLWMAEPVSVLQKHKWKDTIEFYNHGDIGTDQDLFSTPTFSGAYRFYITEYKTQQDNQIEFQV